MLFYFGKISCCIHHSCALGIFTANNNDLIRIKETSIFCHFIAKYPICNSEKFLVSCCMQSPFITVCVLFEAMTLSSYAFIVIFL